MTVHCGTSERAYASTCPDLPSSPVASERTPESAVPKRLTPARLRGRAKPASTDCCLRSMIVRPAKPRSIDSASGVDGLISRVPVRTPVIVPFSSRVGTAVTMTCRRVARPVRPSLTNGLPVANGDVKYERSATLAAGPGVARLVLTRTSPSRSTQARPASKTDLFWV